MKKTPLYMLVILLLIVTTNLVLAEVTPADLQKIVREENKKTTDEIMQKLEVQKKSTIDDIYALANTMASDFQKIVTDTEKKIILISAVSLIGIILLTEGILGFIRIRKEQNVLLILKKDINYLKDSHDNFKLEFDKLKNFSYTQKQVSGNFAKSEVNQVIGYNNQKEENKEEEIREKKIKELKEELGKLENTQKQVSGNLAKSEVKVEVPPVYVETVKKKRGFFRRKSQ